MTNPFGRALSLAYDVANRVNTIAVPGGGTLAYGYDGAGNLSSITFPDTAVRRYIYENPTWRNAMTGIIDETGRRIVTWGYDAAGRPNYNHYGEGINPLSVSYGAGQVTTTDARGTARSRTLAVVGGRQRVTALTVAATADSTATSTSYGFDGYGHLSRVTARSGAVNQTVNDARGRPLSVTWASSSPNMRTVQHNWHGVWNIALSSQKSGITTSRTVDKNGRVIRVMRTAADGTSYVVRQRSYNAQHLLASLTNARGGVRTFGYDAQGNRTSVTNAVGQTTWPTCLATKSTAASAGRRSPIRRCTSTSNSSATMYFEIRSRTTSQRRPRASAATTQSQSTARRSGKCRLINSWTRRGLIASFCNVMKYSIALVILSLTRAALAADGRLPDGWHEAKAFAFGSHAVVVRAEVGPLNHGRCTGWRWGAEGECPRSALVDLTVAVDGKQIFVPQGAFSDLGSPTRMSLRTGTSSLDVVFTGGDAASAYRATLKFSRTELKRRRVSSAEFERTAWEDTTYSFPK